MVSTPGAANSATRDHAIAQYLVTKVSWKGSYKRILTVTPSSVLTYNTETYQCTCQWDLSEIEEIEIASEKDQFVLRLEKSRAFRLTKVRFHCAARAHFLSLVTKLRRHFAIEPVALSSVADEAQAWKKYRCIEFFGDGSSQSFYLQVGVSAILLLDDGGRKMDSFPYIYLKKAASTHSHPDGIVLGTPYQERLFLCSQRNECLGDVYIAAGELGVELHWEESPLNVQLLRLRNSQMIDNPSIVCFEVLKASDDGSFFMEVQLILQGDTLVEVHPKIRSVVARKYTKLLNIIRTDWDIDTVGLEFAEGESLVVKLEARDQLIALLLLTCRENGYEHITLTATEIKKNRVYYPHVSENSTEPAGSSMENFFLRRLLQTGVSGDENVVIGARGSPPAALLRRQSATESSWLQRKVSRRKRSEGAMMLGGGGTRDSFETGESMNDFVSTSIAMEELNTNIPLNEVNLFCQKEVLNSAVELLAEHFTLLVITLRRFVSAANAEIVTALQALVRLSYSSHASLSDKMIPRVFDAIHELFTQQDFLTCYWCLKLLQCYFDPTRVEFIYGQRAKILQYVSTQKELLSSLVNLLPSLSQVSARSSGYWLLGSDGVMEHRSRHSSMNSTLQSKEARLEKEMNAVFYEALFTIHYITIYLHEKGREQAGAKDGAQTGEAAQAHREFNNNRGTGQLPRRRTKPTEFPAVTASMVDITSGIPAKQKRFFAEKLMEKHEFLMDSVVDTRLVRTCLSCVALIRFLTLELGKNGSTPAKASTSNGKTSRKNDAASSPQEDVSSRRVVKDQSFSTESGAAAQNQQQQQRRGGATMRRGATVASFQDVHRPRDNQSSLPNFGLEEVLERRLKKLNAFLEMYTAKIRTQNDRSHLFQGQQTIIVPLTGFSQSTDEFAVSEKTQSSDCMKLEHLEIVDAEDEDGGDGGRGMTEFNLSFREQSKDAPRSSDAFSEEQKDHEQVRGRAPSSNLFRSSTFYFDQQHDSSPNNRRNHDHERRTSVERHRRTKSSPAIRVDAHHCDACIGCNDVCDNVMCFFCSEKKYQLKTTFPDSPLMRTGSPSTQQRPGAHNEPESDNYVHTERKYSSCELKRHRSLRSCWVVVSGEVHDITDLLSVHPGGLQVLLQAAQQGADCASIMEEHPPSARRVLSNYRLGEYYECEKRTLFP